MFGRSRCGVKVSVVNLESPNVASAGGVHGGGGRAPERLGKLRHLRERAVDAPTVRRVRVREEFERLRLGPRLGAPVLRLRNEEELAVRSRRGACALALLCGPDEGLVGELDAADVGNVLPQREVAVDGVPVHLHAGIEVHDALGARVEVVDVGVGPPLLQPPLRVELAALVVKPVRHLVHTHAHTHTYTNTHTHTGVGAR